MKRGTVKFYNPTRGFGFIKMEESDEELFVHKSEINGIIHENDTVEFEVQKGPKGLNAVKVKAV